MGTTFSSLVGSKPVVIYEAVWHRMVPWVGAHVLRLGDAITILPEMSGGSDTTYDSVRVVCCALLAMLATIVWSLMDRKRATYSTLDQWLRLYVRVALACVLFTYGANKLVPAQMPPPTLSTLMQPFRDLTPYRLSWTLLRPSSPYHVFPPVPPLPRALLLL